MQNRIFEISPEHASKLNEWKNMKSLTSRVGPAVYTAMEDVMVAGGMSTPIIPQTWLRDPVFLLKTARSQKDGLTSEEQKVTVHRLLGLSCQRAKEGGARFEG